MTSQIPRIIARLDIKGKHLIKGINYEGLRVIGDSELYVKSYYENNIDEIILIDAVASLYGKNHLGELIGNAVKNVFVPITVAGGIRSIDDVNEILRLGADKVAINTAVVKNPSLIRSISKKFGSQCMVLQIDAKKNNNGWEVYIDGGRERTGLDVIKWIKEGISLGVGEIFLSSIDQDGTKKGMDIDLIREVSKVCTIPFIISGGVGCPNDVVNALRGGKVDGVAIGSILHYKKYAIQDIKEYVGNELGCEMR